MKNNIQIEDITLNLEIAASIRDISVRYKIHKLIWRSQIYSPHLYCQTIIDVTMPQSSGQLLEFITGFFYAHFITLRLPILIFICFGIDTDDCLTTRDLAAVFLPKNKCQTIISMKKTKTTIVNQMLTELPTRTPMPGQKNEKRIGELCVLVNQAFKSFVIEERRLQ